MEQRMSSAGARALRLEQVGPFYGTGESVVPWNSE